MALDWRRDGWDPQASLEELAQLAETANLNVVGSATQRLSHPHATHYVGSGKLDEIKTLRAAVDYDVVLINDELSPTQLRHLEDALEVKVIDRTALILDIFAKRAQSHEGRLQVELAQLQYRLPRLTRMWTHLSRQTAGGVGLRGPGETQLESDRRQARQRISLIKQQLGDVHRHRQLYRDHRRRRRVPVVALVGYTNAGKSTLLNRLAESDVLAEDKLFATLDPTTRSVTLPSGRQVLLTDTVGFINNLPTFLVSAFRATLEEILEADLLIHVVDATHPMAIEQTQTVKTVLEDLGADGRPTITALNKSDQVLSDDAPDLEQIQCVGVDAGRVLISAASGAGLDDLLRLVEQTLAAERALVDVDVVVPYSQARLVELFHRRGQVERETFAEDGTRLTGRLPVELVSRFERYLQPSVNGAVQSSHAST